MSNYYKKNHKHLNVTYSYAGTLITGTSTTAKVFKKSKLPEVKKNDTYLNTATGHVYQCTVKGKVSEAKWKYVRTVLVSIPNSGPGAPGISRGEVDGNGNVTFTASWGIDGNYTNAQNGGRAESTCVKWGFAGDAWVVAGQTSHAAAISRGSYYPHTGTRLQSVGVTVTPSNVIGRNDGLAVSGGYSFAVPPRPTMDGWKFDAETGIVSTKVSFGGGGSNERRFSSWRIEVTDVQADKTWVSSRNDACYDGAANVSYNVTNYQSLNSDQYVRVRLIAVSKGFAGDSATLDTSYYVSFPKPVSIKGVSVSSKDSGGKCTASVKVTQSTAFPVDRIKLQKLVNVSYETASAIPGDASWTDAGAVDDGNCTALSCGVSDLMPDKGKRTWLRVKAWHAAETLCSYSELVQVSDFYEALPSAVDNVCTVASATAIDGESIDVLVAWDLKSTEGDDDTTSVELAWSQDPDAWRSVDGPDDYEIDWTDETTASSVSSVWNKSALVKVTGLDEGSKYYFRARCVTEAEGTKSYGAWCNMASETTTAAPPAVVLATPSTSVPTGSGIPFSWVLSAAGVQAAWELFKRDYELTADETVDTRKTYYALVDGVYTKVNSPQVSGLSGYYEQIDTILAHAENQAGSCALGWERVSANLEDGAIECRVRCSTGSAWVESLPVTVNVADPPQLAVSASTLTAQPLSATLECDVMPESVAYTLTAPDGSTVASGMERPAFSSVPWAESVRGIQVAALADALEDELAEISTLADAQADAESCLSDLQDALDALSALDEGDSGYDDAVEAVNDATDALVAANALLARFDELEALQDEAENGPVMYQAQLSMASGLPFDDGKDYMLSATATSALGLASEAATATVHVNWAHKAPMPSDSIEVDADSIETDDNRMHRRATVTLAAPSGAAAGDVYDVYRKTHDGLTLVSPEAGFALDHVFTDEYATFGDAGDYAYRIACRTVDGDSQYADFDYVLDGECLRFDFGGNYVELPYSIVLKDAYKKDSETVTHMNGETEAYFNEGVTRKASLSSDIVRIEDADVAAAVRALAQYAGPVFVRTPDGSAYEADVQVNSMDVGYGVIAASFDASQVAASGEYGITSAMPDEYIVPDATTTTTTGEE